MLQQHGASRISSFEHVLLLFEKFLHPPVRPPTKISDGVVTASIRWMGQSAYNPQPGADGTSTESDLCFATALIEKKKVRVFPFAAEWS